MSQTVTELAKHCNLHLIALLDYATEEAAHAGLAEQCASAEFVIRMKGAPHHLGSITPHAVTEFRNADLEWLIHRQIYLHTIDVVQLEYMPMGQYGASFRQIACILFEHDVYFQSIARQLPGMRNVIRRIKATFEYMRALRYELRLLPHMDRIQVCSADNAGYLTSFLPDLRNRIDADLRAGIRATDYSYSAGGREPETMLFLGSFRHLPNQEALEWFVRDVLPRIVDARPTAKLIVIGSDPPPRHSIPNSANVELFGFVPDIAEAMSRYAVFVCPILSGSGVRVKLLEAFASGIPVVSTRLGAEGLASEDGHICRLADDPQLFAEHVLNLFDHPDDAAAMAARARAEIVHNRDMPAMTRKLELSYRNELRRKRRS
jgi:glycosyltransferase involved in cell wall biosynthesis